MVLALLATTAISNDKAAKNALNIFSNITFSIEEIAVIATTMTNKREGGL